MSKNIKRTFVLLGLLILLLILIAAVLFFNELRSLASIQLIDDHPLYSMSYYGDYGFEEFLKTGAKSDADIEKFVTKRLLKGLELDLGVVGDGCNAFSAKNEEGDVLFARNFDFSYTPALLLKTKPKNGYASVSTVNLTFAGYTKENLPDGLSFKSFLMLAAPYLPFDGMNEKGLTIALLAVPQANLPYDPDKVTLNTTAMIRLLLDYAATVDEAVELIKNYNIYFSAGVDCHYLIADASGRSMIVEFWDGEVKTVEPTGTYQIASNFIAYNGLNIGEGYDEFERYDRADRVLKEGGGVIHEDRALDLLSELGVYYNGEDKLQWSVVYNLTELKGRVFAGRNKENMYPFSLN